MFVAFITSYAMGIFFGVSQAVYKTMLRLPRPLPGQRWYLHGLGEVLVLHVEEPFIFYETAETGGHWHCKSDDFRHNAVLMLSDPEIEQLVPKDNNASPRGENVISFPNKTEE
jgi:hypothetical protein